jgi:hypothetical protein
MSKLTINLSDLSGEPPTDKYTKAIDKKKLNLTQQRKKINLYIKKLCLLKIVFSNCRLDEKIINNKAKKIMSGRSTGFYDSVMPENCTETLKKEYNCFILFTGVRSGVIGFDIDDKTDGNTKNGFKMWNSLIDEHGDINTWKSVTGNKGFHYYFKYDNRTKLLKNKSKIKMNGEEYSIDIRNEKGLMFEYPTSYESVLDGSTKVYEWINSPMKTELQEMPDWLYNLINCEDNMVSNNKIIDRRSVKQPRKKVQKEMTINNNVNNRHYNNSIRHEELKLLKNLLSGLNHDKSKQYGQWLDIGIILFNETDGLEDGLQLWIDYVKMYIPEALDEYEMKGKWNEFNIDHESKLTIRTLKKYVREYNEETYNNIMEGNIIKNRIFDVNSKIFYEDIDSLNYNDMPSLKQFFINACTLRKSITCAQYII